MTATAGRARAGRSGLPKAAKLIRRRPMKLAELQQKMRKRAERLKKNPPRETPSRPQPPMTDEDREAERQALLADCNKP